MGRTNVGRGGSKVKKAGRGRNGANKNKPLDVSKGDLKNRDFIEIKSVEETSAEAFFESQQEFAPDLFTEIPVTGYWSVRCSTLLPKEFHNMAIVNKAAVSIF